MNVKTLDNQGFFILSTIIQFQRISMERSQKRSQNVFKELHFKIAGKLLNSLFLSLFCNMGVDVHSCLNITVS